ncbi:hypothetical protein Syun_016347 [Stephania yunnanensis]|uniref:Uncharacterized protein n=1 Tax=Stephania yunnanensis TaxID=152371 RepID=A0AAP0J5T3_9MAGN
MASTSRAIIESVLYLETLFFHQPRMSKSPFCFSHPSSKYIYLSPTCLSYLPPLLKIFEIQPLPF